MLRTKKLNSPQSFNWINSMIVTASVMMANEVQPSML